MDTERRQGLVRFRVDFPNGSLVSELCRVSSSSRLIRGRRQGRCQAGAIHRRGAHLRVRDDWMCRVRSAGLSRVVGWAPIAYLRVGAPVCRRPAAHASTTHKQSRSKRIIRAVGVCCELKQLRVQPSTSSQKVVCELCTSERTCVRAREGATPDSLCRPGKMCINRNFQPFPVKLSP